MALVLVFALYFYQTADSILDRYIESLGGTKTLERIETRVTRGSIVTQAGSIPYVVYQKAPDRFLVSIDAVEGNSKNAFDGTKAWSRTPKGELRDVSGPELEMFKREYALRREVGLRGMYSGFKVRSLDGDESVIEAEVAGGTSDILYFDKRTGLLNRIDVTIQGMMLQTVFEDYRNVDGVMLPFLIRRSRPGFTWSYKVDKVLHNSEIEDTFFAKPSGVIMQNR